VSDNKLFFILQRATMSLVQTILSRLEAVLFAPHRSAQKSRSRHGLITILQWIYLAVQKSRDDELVFKAYSLTFIAALSIVPILALTFSIAKGFGMDEALRSLLMERATGVQPEVLDRIFEYVRNTNVKTLGTIGLLAALYTAIKAAGSMEAVFNQIWRVSVHRSFFRKFSDYLSVIAICPLLVLAATGLTASLKSTTLGQTILGMQYIGDFIRFLLSLGSYFSLWIAFTLIYVFLPNTRVRITYAMAGGVVAGTLWSVVQAVYIGFQVGISKYNAIYGTFASLPLFLMWLYLSSAILLFGAELSWAVGGLKSAHHRTKTKETLSVIMEEMAVKIMVLFALKFQQGAPPLTEKDLVSHLRADASLVASILERLHNKNLVAALISQPQAFQLARAAERITLKDVVAAVQETERYYSPLNGERLKDAVCRPLWEARERCAQALSQTTIQDLLSLQDTVSESRNVR
jgi:membrane protein